MSRRSTSTVQPTRHQAHRRLLERLPAQLAFIGCLTLAAVAIATGLMTGALA